MISDNHDQFTWERRRKCLRTVSLFLIIIFSLILELARPWWNWGLFIFCGVTLSLLECYFVLKSRECRKK